MKNCAVKAMTQHQANATLSAGNVGTLFFPPIFYRTFKKAPQLRGFFCLPSPRLEVIKEERKHG